MGDPAVDLSGHWSYRHYKTWPDEERWELIEGRAYAMSPAPTRYHQDLSGRLFADIHAALRGKPCKVYAAPFDVLMPAGEEADDEVDTVVQPDIVVYCDRSKLTRAGARGAPDLVVEILSPSTARKDQHEKYALYERSGVREYWVVDPVGKWLCVYRPAAPGRFDSGELRDPVREYGPVASRVLEGFSVEPGRLFAED